MARKRNGVGWVSALSLEVIFLVGVIAIAKPDILADFLSLDAKSHPQVENEDAGDRVETYQVSRVLPP